MSANDRIISIKSPASLTQRMFVALVVMLFGSAVVLAVAAIWRGQTGAQWALVALAICAVAALPSVVFGRFIRGPQAALWAMLLGMGFRMTAALAGCLLVNAFWHDGIEAGFGWYLVAAYLITLMAETLFIASAPRSQLGEQLHVQNGTTPTRTGIAMIEGEQYG
jgi:hypothetical protein